MIFLYNCIFTYTHFCFQTEVSLSFSAQPPSTSEQPTAADPPETQEEELKAQAEVMQRKTKPWGTFGLKEHAILDFSFNKY